MKVPMSKPFHCEEIEQAVLAVLRSGRTINGPELKGFEQDFAAHMGTAHAVGVNSCTSALQLALLALGVGRGDEVVVPSHTAYPTIEPIHHVGARPVFADVDATHTMDPEDFRRKITPATKAVIPVHLYGLPCDMTRITVVATEHGIPVIEDCAQAHDAVHRGRKVGTWGAMACYSFFPSKNMTVGGDGGMVVTGDPALARTVRMLRDHGREARYEHELVGFNYRMAEMQAAVGRVQLRRLDGFTAARQERAALYDERLAGLPLVLPPRREGDSHVFHLYVVRVDGAARRDGLMEHLKSREVACNIHYPVPGHLQPGSRAAGFGLDRGSLPVTERFVDGILSLPMHPTLTTEEIDAVCAAVREYLEA